MTREAAEALIASARPGWRLLDMTELDDESGPSFELAIGRGEERRTLLVAGDEEIVGERG